MIGNGFLHYGNGFFQLVRSFFGFAFLFRCRSIGRKRRCHDSFTFRHKHFHTFGGFVTPLNLLRGSNVSGQFTKRARGCSLKHFAAFIHLQGGFPYATKRARDRALTTPLLGIIAVFIGSLH